MISGLAACSNETAPTMLPEDFSVYVKDATVLNHPAAGVWRGWLDLPAAQPRERGDRPRLSMAGKLRRAQQNRQCTFHHRFGITTTCLLLPYTETAVCRSCLRSTGGVMTAIKEPVLRSGGGS